jgi:hypothetical protein
VSVAVEVRGRDRVAGTRRPVVDRSSEASGPVPTHHVGVVRPRVPGNDVGVSIEVSDRDGGRAAVRGVADWPREAPILQPAQHRDEIVRGQATTTGSMTAVDRQATRGNHSSDLGGQATARGGPRLGLRCQDGYWRLATWGDRPM